MTLHITPSWDPTGTLGLTLDREKAELVVTVQGEQLRYVLSEERPERLGWHEYRSAQVGAERWVSVGEVVCHCLGEQEAEDAVLALSRLAAGRAVRRGGDWSQAATRLRKQCATGRGRRFSALPFQAWWSHLSDPARGEGERLTETTAALRAGFRMGDGRPDTMRLLRRLGVAERQDRNGCRARSRTVNHDTGLALCRALDRDPVDLGL